MIKCKECLCFDCDCKFDCDHECCVENCSIVKECEKNDYGWINPNEE